MDNLEEIPEKKGIKRFFSKKVVIVGSIIIAFILIVVVYQAFFKEKESPYVTQKIEKGDLVQTVSATGTVESASELKLNFQIAGKIAEIKVKENDFVKKDDLLVTLDAGSIYSQLSQQKAAIDIAQANLNKIISGATTEDLQVSQENVNIAETSYNNALRDYDALKDKLEKEIKSYEESVSAAEIALTDAETNLLNVQTTQDQNIINAENSAITSLETNIVVADLSKDNIKDLVPTLKGIVSNTAALDSVEVQLASVTTSLQNDRININYAKTQKGYFIESSLSSLQSSLTQILSAISSMSLLVNGAIGTTSSERATITSAKTIISTEQASVTAAITALQTSQQTLINSRNTHQAQVDTYKSAVNTAKSSLTTAQDNLNTAKASKNVSLSTAQNNIDSTLAQLNLAKAQYDLKKAPARTEDIGYYQGQLNQARASYSLVANNLKDYSIRAPIDGQVSFINYEVGETTSITQPVVQMVGVNSYDISVDVPESDIAKIKLGQSVEITLDAYSDDLIFNGEILSIDPAQTVIQDVVYYKVKVSIDADENEIKPGMTANVDIITNSKDNVLIIPQRAVKTDDQGQYVEILENGKAVPVSITTGIKGDGGKIEVYNSLKEGQDVIVFTKETK